jgi:ABC-type nitrate/sulfonate/bicarbonate transport system substrate-binding protein
MDLNFIPSINGISNIAGLIKSKKINAATLNYELKDTFVDKFKWEYSGSFIKKAIYIISYKPISSKNDLQNLKIISSFKGGSPEKLYNKLHINNKPIFTDVMIAIQLFLKKDYDAILLPEPMISKIINMLTKKNIKFSIFDLSKNIDYHKPVNALITRPEIENKKLEVAFKQAINIINKNPEYAAETFVKYFKKYYKRNFDKQALKEAISSGRLVFEYQK